MKIVKGSSFATWTKKLQGKGGGFSNFKNKSSPRSRSKSPTKSRTSNSPNDPPPENSEDRDEGDTLKSKRFDSPTKSREDCKSPRKSLSPTKSASSCDDDNDPPPPPPEAIEERGDSSGKLRTEDKVDQRDDVSINERLDETELEETNVNNPYGFVSQRWSSFRKRSKQEFAATDDSAHDGKVDHADEEHKDATGDGDLAPVYSDESELEAKPEKMNSLPDRQEPTRHQLGTENNQNLVSETKNSTLSNAKLSIPVLSDKVENNDQDDAILLPGNESLSSSSGIEVTESHSSRSQGDESIELQVNTESSNKGTGPIDSHNQNSASDMPGKMDSDRTDAAKKHQADISADECVGVENINERNRLASQNNEPTRQQSMTRSFQASSKMNGATDLRADGDASVASMVSAASLNGPNTGQASSVPFFHTNAEDNGGKLLPGATNANEAQLAETTYDQLHTCIDKTPSSASQVSFKSAKSDSSKSTAKKDTLNNVTLSKVEEGECSDANGQPARRFPKSKLASWVGFKRLTKSDKKKEDKEARPLEKEHAMEEQTIPKKEVNGSSIKKMTMKNLIRQEKRALGRVKQKQKKMKNSLVGVGEIIPASASLVSSSLANPSVAIQNGICPGLPPKLSPRPKGTINKPNRIEADNTSDRIWWASGKQGVEMRTGKSDQVAQAEDKEAGKKESKNRNGKNGIEEDPDGIKDKHHRPHAKDAVENQFSAETEKFRANRSKTKDKDVAGNELVKKSTDMKRHQRSPSPHQRKNRERSRERKSRRKGNHSRRAVSSKSSELSEDEHCVCNQEVIEEGRILCNAETEEAGCRDIRFDLKEMAKELLRQGPAVMVNWLE